MNVINGAVQVGDVVAYPTHGINKGLAMKIGRVTELRPEKEALQVEVVYSTFLPGNAHQQVRAELCVIIDRRGHNA
jgi:hypothetical protein